MKKGTLNTQRISVDLSQINQIEFQTITTSSGRPAYPVALEMKDGSQHTLPGGGERQQIKQSAERIARATGVKMVSRGDKEAAAENSETENTKEPLYKRLDSPEQPIIKKDDGYRSPLRRRMPVADKFARQPITLWVTEKQAAWLRSEIRHQLWSRRAQIDKSQ